MKPGSQCAQIVALLETGPKTTAEILRAVPCIVHSRIAELRATHGFTIVHERTGPGASGSRYTLVSTEAGADPSPVSEATRLVSPEGPGRGQAPTPGSSPVQLELVA